MARKRKKKFNWRAKKAKHAGRNLKAKLQLKPLLALVPDREPAPKESYTLRRKALKELGFASYPEYLKSDLWADIKKRVLAVSSCCEPCGKPAIGVHHRSYDKETMAGETLKYLTPICHACHQLIEFRVDGTKAYFWEANARLHLLIHGINPDIDAKSIA